MFGSPSTYVICLFPLFLRARTSAENIYARTGRKVREMEGDAASRALPLRFEKEIIVIVVKMMSRKLCRRGLGGGVGMATLPRLSMLHLLSSLACAL